MARVYEVPIASRSIVREALLRRRAAAHGVPVRTRGALVYLPAFAPESGVEIDAVGETRAVPEVVSSDGLSVVFVLEQPDGTPVELGHATKRPVSRWNPAESEGRTVSTSLGDVTLPARTTRDEERFPVDPF